MVRISTFPAKKSPGSEEPGDSRLTKNLVPERMVGASLARPPKNSVFRIFRRKITVFFACRRRILLGQNPRATEGRPYGYFFNKCKRTPREGCPYGQRMANVGTPVPGCPFLISGNAGVCTQKPENGVHVFVYSNQFTGAYIVRNAQMSAGCMQKCVLYKINVEIWTVFMYNDRVVVLTEPPTDIHGRQGLPERSF